ncbi:MAG TPA: tripartite tricarboxylate transporter permease [Candidatus Eisenbacteria bacterium]|nr:tripartite tricarboxylate transporter permease [Candidatus Eisenbacteria bacterium]
MLDYLAAFQTGLMNILPFTEQGQQSFLFMLVGIFIGFWVGILPGLGGATTLALMLPFIYTMDPTTAFAFLLGANAVTSTTGDMTSILFGVPGEGITAATVVDGHPMAKNGEAGRALGAALMSSLVGSIFGAVALAIALAIVRPLVLSIGAAEFFMLALLGITFLSSLSGGNLIKGLIGGGLGLCLAMVGLDPIESVPRYTLEPILGEANALFLWDGVALVPVTIGLFAIPEIIDLAVQRTSIARTAVSKVGGVLEGVKDTFRHWKLVMRCSALGAYVGVLPGVGGGTAQWVAYAHAVQSSRNKERFGKGAVEGVLGPGAANNSTRGGDLVTTVAFGIPSSVSTAILLGAFIIQGIVPGPDLLNPAKHLTLTASFVWILIVANIVTVAFCFLFLKPLTKITFIKGSLIIPFLLLLVFLGGFAVKNSLGDMIVVLLFGALGLFMVKFDWPRPPLLLGLVLGGIAETNLFIATRIYGWSWVTEPGVLVIAGLIALGILYPWYEKWRERRLASEPATPPAAEPDHVTEPVPRRSRLARALFALFFVAVFGFVVYEARFGFGAWEPRAALFPLAIGIPSLVLAVLVLLKEAFLFERTVAADEAATEPPKPALAPDEVRNRTMVIASWIIGFFLAIWFLGFPIASAFATFLYIKFAGRERWATSVALALFAWLFFYGMFDYALKLPFPDGVLMDWLEI